MVKTNHLFIFFGIASLFLASLACNLGQTAPAVDNTPPQESAPSAPPQEAATPEPAESPTAQVEATALTACSNPYLPVAQGATWEYKMTGTAPSAYTRSIIEMEADHFTDQDVFVEGITRQGRWTCENGALTALDLGRDTGLVESEYVTVDLHTTSASGVTLPAALNPGDTWTQEVLLEGTETLAGQEIPVSNEVSNVCSAAGSESVNVEAGAFEAFRVDCKMTMLITMTLFGSQTSQTMIFETSNWYASGVGLVKSSTNTALGLGDEGLESVSELTSYSIP